MSTNKKHWKYYVKSYSRAAQDLWKLKEEPIRLINFTKFTKPEENWFFNFCKYHNLLPAKGKLSFFAVFGAKELAYIFGSPKIFFTGENLHNWYKDFDYEYQNKFDLALGFDPDDKLRTNYMRFPFWIPDFIPYNFSFEDIKTMIDNINNQSYRLSSNRTRFACNISGHDQNGIRKKIIDSISETDQVTCAGNFMRTTHELQEHFNNDKILYLKNFKFNICPENSNAYGYVTEKVFHAIKSGCIPIYWGSDNSPEINILNQDAIIFYDESGNANHSRLIEDLWTSNSRYLDFISQPIFKDNAEDVVWDYIAKLKSRISDVI